MQDSRNKMMNKKQFLENLTIIYQKKIILEK